MRENGTKAFFAVDTSFPRNKYNQTLPTLKSSSLEEREYDQQIQIPCITSKNMSHGGKSQTSG